MVADTLAETAYFPGEFLSANDYADEQAYQIAAQRAGGRTLNGWGIVTGLQASQPAAGDVVMIQSGLAIDGQGRLILLTAPTPSTPPPTGNQLLTIRHAEVAVAGEPGRVGTIVDQPTLAWIAEGSSFNPAIQLVLATCIRGTLTPEPRIYAGVDAGTITFHSPTTETDGRLVGWSAAPRAGLRIETDQLTVVAPQTPNQSYATATLSISQGALGVGTMSPQAYLDVLAPNAALTGPGRLTSFDTLVRGTAPNLSQILHLGDILLVIDREGRPTQSPVVSITVDGDLRTATPLNCADAPFVYEQALTVSMRGADSIAPAALNIDRLAKVGFQVDVPQAQLHVGGGDLLLSTNATVVRFAGDGTLETVDGGSRVQFQPTIAQLSFDQQGDIHWLPGRVQTAGLVPPVGMALTVEGNLGVGTLQPAARLDVVGAIQLLGLDSGLIFPDGSVQTVGETSIPIGSIIDWWQGTATQKPPTNYMICSGGKVSDPDSPLNGKVLPNLANLMTFGAANDLAATYVVGDDNHTHPYATPQHVHGMPHTHPPLGGTTGGADHDDGMAGAPDNNAASGHAHNWTATVGESSTENTQVNSDAGKVYSTGVGSTLPPYVSLLKLIRIK